MIQINITSYANLMNDRAQYENLSGLCFYI